MRPCTILLILTILALCCSGIWMPIYASYYLWGFRETNCTIDNIGFDRYAICQRDLVGEVYNCPTIFWNITYASSNIKICERAWATSMTERGKCYVFDETKELDYMNRSKYITYLKEHKSEDKFGCYYYGEKPYLLFKDVYDPIKDHKSKMMIIAITIICVICILDILIICITNYLEKRRKDPERMSLLPLGR